MNRLMVAIFSTSMLLLVAGCGQVSKEEYIRQFNAAHGPLISFISDPPDTSTNAERISYLTDLARIYEDTASGIEEIEPPEEVVDLHERYSTVVREIGESFVIAKENIEEGDRETARNDFQVARERTKSESSAISAEYRQRGYYIKALEEGTEQM